MHKLIVIHDQDMDLLAHLAHKYGHHIKCPQLFYVAGMATKPDDPIDALAKVATELWETSGCATILVANHAHITEHIDDYRKRFNVFNIYTDPLLFSANRDQPGVWLASTEEVPYAFNQMINWVYDV